MSGFSLEGVLTGGGFDRLPWQHRLCDTGINITEYRNAMRGDHLDWVCTPCLVDANDEYVP